MSSKTTESERRARRLEVEIERRREALAALKRRAPRVAVKDYELRGAGGRKVRLSRMFGRKRDLIVIHNMGAACPYCTLWADGFNGIYDHLADRSAFVLVSADPPSAQSKFARSRGWRFPIYSNGDSGFTEAMGYVEERKGKQHQLPGVSTFQKTRNGKIVRVARARFGPGDPFCGLWHLFELLADGPSDWSPRYRYA